MKETQILRGLHKARSDMATPTQALSNYYNKGTAFVKGPKGKDKVKAHLTRGEAVLPAATVQKVGAKNIARLIADTNNGTGPKRTLRSGIHAATGFVEDVGNLYKGAKDVIGSGVDAVKGMFSGSAAPIAGESATAAAPSGMGAAPRINPASVTPAAESGVWSTLTKPMSMGGVMRGGANVVKGALAPAALTAAAIPYAAGAAASKMSGGSAITGATDQDTFGTALGEGAAKLLPVGMGGLTQSEMAAGDLHGASALQPGDAAAKSIGLGAAKVPVSPNARTMSGTIGADMPPSPPSPFADTTQVLNGTAANSVPAIPAQSALRWDTGANGKRTLTNLEGSGMSAPAPADPNRRSTPGQTLTDAQLDASRAYRGGKALDPSKMDIGQMEAAHALAIKNGDLNTAMMLKGSLGRTQARDLAYLTHGVQRAQLANTLMQQNAERNIAALKAANPDFVDGKPVDNGPNQQEAVRKVNQAIGAAGMHLGHLNPKQMQELIIDAGRTKDVNEFNKSVIGKLTGWFKNGKAPMQDQTFTDTRALAMHGGYTQTPQGQVPNSVAQGGGFTAQWGNPLADQPDINRVRLAQQSAAAQKAVEDSAANATQLQKQARR